MYIIHCTANKNKLQYVYSHKTKKNQIFQIDFCITQKTEEYFYNHLLRLESTII